MSTENWEDCEKKSFCYKHKRGRPLLCDDNGPSPFAGISNRKNQNTRGPILSMLYRSSQNVKSSGSNKQGESMGSK